MMAAVASATAVFACVGWFVTAPTADERTSTAPLADSAAAALRTARGLGAAARAPLSLAFAEEAYAAGLLEQRRQELRMSLRRDYRPARATLERARALADAAARASRRNAHRENRSAADAVASARLALAPLHGVEDRVWMPPTVRNRLQRARTFALEGSSLVAEGAYDSAMSRALKAADEAAHVSTSLWQVTSRYADAAHLARWRSWVADAAAWSRRTGRTALVVDKDAHEVVVYRAGRVYRVYDAELGWNNVGDKRAQGDGATPEGHYRITELKSRGRSRYHKALLLDYPNAEDVRNLDALKASGAVPRGTRPGGLIEIHGEGARGKDWTDGCVAVTNGQMDELFKLVGVGTPVTIVGSRSGDGVFATLARRLER
jgi:lipoprotein-anchoring transpeptidase ErfK/SrfK